MILVVIIWFKWWYACNIITFIVSKSKVESDARRNSAGERSRVVPKFTVDFLQIAAGGTPALHRQRKESLWKSDLGFEVMSCDQQRNDVSYVRKYPQSQSSINNETQSWECDPDGEDVQTFRGKDGGAKGSIISKIGRVAIRGAAKGWDPKFVSTHWRAQRQFIQKRVISLVKRKKMEWNWAFAYAVRGHYARSLRTSFWGQNAKLRLKDDTECSHG